jgi:xanthine/CO dehydrogenase XdhC/CoxF family maturation factor
MKELNDTSWYDKAVLQNKQMALVTMVRVDGSSQTRRKNAGYRRRHMTGVISGGCLRRRLRKAQFDVRTKEQT